jgi:hypothetical protein
MPGFDGTGPQGLGPITGGGRGFCVVPISPSSPIYKGKEDYPPNDVPRNKSDYGARHNTQTAISFKSRIKGKQELDLQKDQYQAMRRQLEHIERRIQQLQNKR